MKRVSSKHQRGGESSSSFRNKRKNKGNASSDNNPYGITFRDNVQRARYETLVQRKIVCTRYMDANTLDAIGILDDVDYMLENVGWTKFSNMTFPTYEKITIEFLSSVEAQIVQGPQCEHGMITFRLFNKEYRLNLAQFNAIYQFPCGGNRATPREYREQEFWAKLTPGSSFDHGKTKSSSLRNPCFRYVHQFLSSSLFGRGDSEGAISKTELMFLWAMVTPGVTLDTGSHLIRHLVKVGNSLTGKIMIGGLITPIALNLGHDLSSLKPVCGNNKLDIEACIAMKMIMRTGDTYSLLLPNSDVTHPLPDPVRTCVHEERNWCFPIDPEPEPHDDIVALRAQLEGMEERQVRMERMLEAVYNWCSQKYPGQFPPPPQPLAQDINDNIAAIQDEFENQRTRLERMDERQVRMERMLEPLFNWYMREHRGQVPPLPQVFFAEFLGAGRIFV